MSPLLCLYNSTDRMSTCDLVIRTSNFRSLRIPNIEHGLCCVNGSVSGKLKELFNGSLYFF